MRRARLVVMVKDPRPGRVKTRLARDIGTIAATWWVRHQTRTLLSRLRDPRWDLILAVTPDRVGLASRAWPADLDRLPQGAGNLGHRMARIFRSLPPGPALIVGSDIPSLDRPHIARAFRALGSADAVLGPAPDGGYWLIGLRRTRALPARLFEGVRWSTGHARADTRATLAPLSVSETDMLQDIDKGADLAAYSK